LFSYRNEKNYPAFIEESAIIYKWIYVSAGVKGMQIKLLPLDFKNVVEGCFSDLII